MQVCAMHLWKFSNKTRHYLQYTLHSFQNEISTFKANNNKIYVFQDKGRFMKETLTFLLVHTTYLTVVAWYVHTIYFTHHTTYPTFWCQFNLYIF